MSAEGIKMVEVMEDVKKHANAANYVQILWGD